jgi:hypothetical protein
VVNVISGDYPEEWTAAMAAKKLYFDALSAIPNASYDDVLMRALGDVESRHIALRILTRFQSEKIASFMPALCEVLLETASEAEAEAVRKIILRAPRPELLGHLKKLTDAVAEDPEVNSFRRRRVEKLLQEVTPDGSSVSAL